MEWNRSNAIGLALASCTFCEGHGMVELIRGAAEKPCDCVFRAIFRACYRRFRDCVLFGSQSGTVSVECTHGPQGRHSYGRKREEYAADFLLVTRRVLTEDEYKLFRYTYLLGASWQLCAPRLGLDRGNFFHVLYRMQAKLGREYSGMEPYPLYPLDEYFGGQVRAKRIEPMTRRAKSLRENLEPRVPMVERRGVAIETMPLEAEPFPLTAA